MAKKPAARKHSVAPTWALATGFAIAILVGGYLSFEFGRIQADFNIGDAIAERKSLQDEIAGLETQIVSLKEEIALQQTHRSIDRKAYEEVEASLTDLQQKIQEQRDAIAFYRGILSPADGQRGLRVQELKLTKGKDDRRYHVRLVLVQVMRHDRSVKGEVDLRLEGAQDGVATTYRLEQLLPADVQSDWPFSFRYFQDFDRELVLPAGFAPERINIEVISKTKSIANVKQSFAWQTGRSQS